MYRPGRSATVAVAWLAIGLAAGPAAGQSISYVDDDASTNGDGVTWETAYKYLQDALIPPSRGRNISDIRVAGGVYKSDQDEAGFVTPGDREATFRLVSGLAVRGGYRGLAGGGDPNDRDIELFVTTLSGDLAGDDGPDFTKRSENSYHVVTGSAVDETAVLDGIAVAGGYANNPTATFSRGAGMYNDCGSPSVDRCTFAGNYAIYGGGAIYNRAGSSPVLTNCEITGNYGGSGGGGVYSLSDSSPVLIDCMLTGNEVWGCGGGMMSSQGSPILTRCTFLGNSCGYNGGGLQVSHGALLTDCVFRGNTAQCGGGVDGGGSVTLINCVLSGNSAVKRGGAVRSEGWYEGLTLVNCVLASNSAGMQGGAVLSGACSTPTLTNCTLAANTAVDGRALACYSNYEPGHVTIVNCILWNGGDEIWDNDGSIIEITYSSIEGGWPGDGNIEADPLFVDADGPDDVPGTADDDLRLTALSPCIDAADNLGVPADATDLDGDGDTTERVPLDHDRACRFVDDPGTEDTGYPDLPDYPQIVDIGAHESPPNQHYVFADDPVAIPEGAAADVLVRLAQDPEETLEVTVSVYSGDSDISVVSGSTLTFDSSDYLTFQTVTLSAEQDPDWWNGTATIRFAAAGFKPGHATAVEADDEPVPPVVFVDAGADGTGFGTSWADAYPELWDALAAVVSRPGSSEVWVAAATYRPAGPEGTRKGSFPLVDGVAVFGGFPPGGGQWHERDPVANETVLSGDLDNDDEPGFAHNDENSYQVVTSIGCDETAVLDGFTITGGNADDIRGYTCGGGMLNEGGGPTVAYCRFVGNYALENGGGICNDSASPALVNCEFSGNEAGNAGGGMYNFDGSAPGSANCTFSGNSGGGVFSAAAAEPMLTNCVLWGNIHAGQMDEFAQLNGGSPVVSYSCVQGWTGYFGGVGNMGGDPMFVDPDGADEVVGTSDDDLRLSAGSACIDMGDNEALPPDDHDRDADGDTAEPIPFDLHGDERLVDDVSVDGTGNGRTPLVDMGADEFEGVAFLRRFVNHEATGADDGTTWANAYADLMDALEDTATSGITEIWVAAGVYRPDRGTGDRGATFLIPEGVRVYGGFGGWETELGQRTPAWNATALSGDLNADDAPGFVGHDENSYHVVTVTSSSSGFPAVIDGFTISGGNANGPYPHGFGGGIYNAEYTIALRECRIHDNRATMAGGGALQFLGGTTTLLGCTISGNESNIGGGIASNIGLLVLTNCTVTRNVGGGVYAGHGASITSCILWGNTIGESTDEPAQIDWGVPMPTINYSCVQGWTGSFGGTGNIGDNPRLRRDGAHIRIRSPCRNAGDPDFTPVEGLTDLDDQARILCGRVDMGADEAALELLTPESGTPLEVPGKGIP